MIDAEAGAFTGFSLDPIRLTARYLFRVEDTYRLRNFESILRRDLAAVMSDQMDNQVINGDGVAPNVNGFLNELTGTRPLQVRPARSPLGLASSLGWLMVSNAYTMSDVRAVIGSDSYGNGETLYKSAQSFRNGDRDVAAANGRAVRFEPHSGRGGVTRNRTTSRRSRATPAVTRWRPCGNPWK